MVLSSEQLLIYLGNEKFHLKHIPRTVENPELSQPAYYCKEYFNSFAGHIVESKYVS